MATIFAFFLFLFSLLWVLRRATKTGRKNPLPPVAGGALPVIGHLHLLGGAKPPHIVLGDIADKYGPLFTLWLGVHRALIVSSWEMAKECFTTNDKAFANRPKVVALEIMGYNYAMFVFSPYGPYWRQVRKRASLELLSNHRLDLLKHVGESEVSTSIRETYKDWIQDNNMVIDMERWLGFITSNVVLRMVVGKRFEGSATKGENESDRCRKVLRTFFDLTGKFVVGDAIPALRWLDVGGYEKAMKQTAKDLDHIVGGWLEEHKQSKASGEVKEHQDFMAVMLSCAANDEEICDFDADTIIKSTILGIILGGTDTTRVTLTWVVSLLLANPEALKKAQQELDVQIGKERQVKESDLKNLVYIPAIIKETMRLYPAGPLAVPHESSEDCIVAGYYVPAGTRLFLNLSKLQRDPRVWPEPDEFRPERFFTTHKGVDVKGQHFELLPFGAGRRICPGISFSMQVMQLTLATLLHSFDIKTRTNEPVDMSVKVAITNLRNTPLEVRFTPRLPAHLYA